MPCYCRLFKHVVATFKFSFQAVNAAKLIIWTQAFFHMHMYPHYRYLGPNLCMNFISWEKHEKCD